MRRLIPSLALLTAFAASAGAQQKPPMGGMKGMHMDSTHAMMPGMTTPCPLHLTTLNLTAAQQATYDSIGKAHEAEMQKLMPMSAGMGGMAKGVKPGEPMPMHAAPAGGMGMMMAMDSTKTAAMEQSMETAVAAVRAILTPEQRVTFDAAVTAHETEMKAMRAKMMPKKPEG